MLRRKQRVSDHRNKKITLLEAEQGCRDDCGCLQTSKDRIAAKECSISKALTQLHTSESEFPIIPSRKRQWGDYNKRTKLPRASICKVCKTVHRLVFPKYNLASLEAALQTEEPVQVKWNSSMEEHISQQRGKRQHMSKVASNLNQPPMRAQKIAISVWPCKKLQKIMNSRTQRVRSRWRQRHRVNSARLGGKEEANLFRGESGILKPGKSSAAGLARVPSESRRRVQDTRIRQCLQGYG